MDLLKIANGDNVAVALRKLSAGKTASAGASKIPVRESIPAGHKLALSDIAEGEAVIKYGFPIGRALCDIPVGAHVHSHNLATALSGERAYAYSPSERSAAGPDARALNFSGYLREDGRAGTRNEIWILPTVGCVNGLAQRIAVQANARYRKTCGGVFAFTHPYGCSQLGDDLRNTQRLLAGLADNPNASGVLVLGLGCETNGTEGLRRALRSERDGRIRFLSAQESGDEIEDVMTLIDVMAKRAAIEQRVPLTPDKLTLGLKCGGSDGFSGITANPLCGRITDALTASGGSAVLTEVPEMFGAEQILLPRCSDKDVFSRAAEMINGFKRYYLKHGQPVYENPSPGNKAGGITTLEEKSLGCVQKGGRAEVTDVLEYGGFCRRPGLSLLSGPGNDMVSSTALTAAGATLILFTTGRGTPFGAPVPTIKVSSNSELFARKPGWTDFDAGRVLGNLTFPAAACELMGLIADVASGAPTKNELNGYREIAIFKDGVTL